MSQPAEWLLESLTFLAFRDLNLYLVIRKKVAPGEMNERMTRWLGQIVERIRRGESIVRLASWSQDRG